MALRYFNASKTVAISIPGRCVSRSRASQHVGRSITSALPQQSERMKWHCAAPPQNLSPGRFTPASVRSQTWVGASGCTQRLLPHQIRPLVNVHQDHHTGLCPRYFITRIYRNGWHSFQIQGNRIMCGLQDLVSIGFLGFIHRGRSSLSTSVVQPMERWFYSTP